MHIPSLLTVITLLSHSLAKPLLTRSSSCGPEARIDIAKGAVTAIGEPTAAESTEAFEALAFSPNAVIIINPDELGNVYVSSDKQSTVAFLAVIYQVVTQVNVDQYLNINETYSFFNVSGQLGLLHALPVPAQIFFDVFLEYTLEPCQLEVVHVFATVPSELLGLLISIETGLSPTPPAPGQ